MRDCLLAVVTGGAVGVLFGLLRLPSPAPGTIAGVLGVAAMSLGWMIVNR